MAARKNLTYLVIKLIKRRLRDAFGEEIEFVEKGPPTELQGPVNDFREVS